MAFIGASYRDDNYCPIYEGERLNCEECGECYEECEECYCSPIQRLGHRLATLKEKRNGREVYQESN